MTTYKLNIFKVILPAVFLLGSCKKFLDVNQNVNDPVAVPVSILLPDAEKNLGNALVIGSGLSQDLAVYTHQLSTREAPDQYGVNGGDFNVQQAWSIWYDGALISLDEIIKSATVDGNFQYAGIAKILKAYGYSQFVDVFGDIPFSEANKFKEGTQFAKFDAAKDIYPALIALINEGIADLNNPAVNPKTPGPDDVIYGGDPELWIKAANTIKLKLYTQVRKVQNVQAEVTALLATPANLINATDESFLVPYGPQGATDDRNPGFGDYYATQRSNHISPWFYEIMKGYNPNIFTNNPDPRVKYYIYNQMKATTAPREGNQTEYRDGPFVSIYFGSVGVDRDRNQQGTISVLGIYPVGGRYDQGDGLNVTSSDATGAAPYRLITYADRLYLEAELINIGLATGDAKAKLQAAIKESFRQVDYVVSNFVKPAQTVPSIVGTGADTTYTKKVLAEYDAGSADRKLEIIMTEKWLSNYGSAVDQYTDYRRTGYPILFDPKNTTMAPGGKVQPPINGDPVNPGVQKPVPVQLSLTYPLSLPWSTSELEKNQSAPPQKNPQSYKIFWQP
ncbi:MAG: SusD/RagB family nutrient-binding outer membrane lipoprotein [Chitinophagaceae bacterium]